MLPSDEAQKCAGRVFRRMIVYTLVEADGVGVDCYLETFDSRNPNFYRRLGFSAVGGRTPNRLRVQRRHSLILLYRFELIRSVAA